MMKHKFYFLLLFVVLLLPLGDLFNTGLPFTHDGQDHVARIANFYQNLQEGNIIPRWAENLNWGYGHPILMFLYPLSSYVASLFHFLGFSFVDSIKLVFGISFILSGFTMYLWLRSFLSLQAAFVGGLLYTFAPYRFVDLYVRGAIGEHVAFIFPPLVLYFLFKLSKKYSYKYILGGSLSLAGLILSHNAISLMFFPIILFYALFLVWQIKWKKYFTVNIFCLLFLGFGLSAFFWLPAFLEGKYTLRDVVTSSEALERFVEFKNLFYSPWSYGGTGQFTVQVGIFNWIAVIISIPLAFYLFKKKNINWVIIFVFLFLFGFTAFLMISGSKSIWEVITLLQKFQFPWRFLSVSVFLSAVLGAFVISTLPKKTEKGIIVIFIILLLFFTKEMWHAKAYLQKPESFYTGVYNGTTDTGESAPIWSVRFMEKKAKSEIEVIQGKADIKTQQKKTTKHVYKVAAIDMAKLRENTLYFPGWHVFVDGKEVPVEFQDPNSRGLMTFWVEKGEHKVDIKFTETKLRLFADLLSLVSLFMLVILSILSKKKLW